MEKELIIVGDRVLISLDEGDNRTDSGLYLPQGVKDKEEVHKGIVVKVGPGYPLPDPTAIESEPWQTQTLEKKYFPLQAKEGDQCIFLTKQGIEIEFEAKKYIVVPHSAILALLRDKEI